MVAKSDSATTAEAVEAIPTTDGGMNVWSPRPKTRLSQCTRLNVCCERNDNQHLSPKASHERDKQRWAAATCTSHYGQVSHTHNSGWLYRCRWTSVPSH
jgi:hypothetical protein